MKNRMDKWRMTWNMGLYGGLNRDFNLEVVKIRALFATLNYKGPQ